ncbi:MAG: PHP domain-containing protein, partial [Spirochaetales bacterium]|nr:PHP domain-containing protein [Spirochaetales bacterium]
MQKAFVHLHNHTDFSLLDGAAPIKRYMEKAKSLGMTSLAITDHGNMFGSLRFYYAAKDAGINPIIGCEFYCNPTGHTERPA